MGREMEMMCGGAVDRHGTGILLFLIYRSTAPIFPTGLIPSGQGSDPCLDGIARRAVWRLRANGTGYAVREGATFVRRV
jgi:hypothetical protein